MLEITRVVKVNNQLRRQKLMNNCEPELKEVNVDEQDSDGRIQMTTRQYRRQQTHRSSRESRRYDENANACEENQYPENMIDRFSCRTWQKHQEGEANPGQC